MQSRKRRDDDIEHEAATKKKKVGAKKPKYKAVLTDIEGTTTPITFVHNVLFPFVLENLDKYLKDHEDDEETKAQIEELRILSEKDIKEGVEGAVLITDTLSLCSNIQWQMSINRKAGPLKSLQGSMWKSAYETGNITGIVYEDVVQALKRWKSKKIPVYIYSSGSVPAQKLLFGNSDHGSLLEYFEGHFDTAVGSKLEASSYKIIAESMGIKPKDIVFLTDNIKECVAAKEAGFQVFNLKRAGNQPIEDLLGFKQIESFDFLF